MNNPIHILVADDDKHDHFFIHRAISAANNKNKITAVYDGEELLDYLLRRGIFQDLKEPFPSAILLDVNMPRLDGFDTLREIKRVNTIKSIPVFVWSTDYSNETVSKALQLGAMSFMAKGSGYTEVARTMISALR